MLLESRCKRLGARGGREGASPVLGRMPNSSGGHLSSATQSTRTPAKKPSLSQRLTPRRKSKAASSPSENKAPASSARGEKSSTSTPKTSQKKRGKASSSARSGAAPATERPLSQRDAIRAASPDEKAELLELATYIAQLRKTEEEEEEVVVAVKEEEATVAQDAEAPETSAAAPLGAATSSSVGTSSGGGSSSSSGSTTTTTAAVQLGAGLSALAGPSTPTAPADVAPALPSRRLENVWTPFGLRRAGEPAAAPSAVAPATTAAAAATSASGATPTPPDFGAAELPPSAAATNAGAHEAVVARPIARGPWEAGGQQQQQQQHAPAPAVSGSEEEAAAASAAAPGASAAGVTPRGGMDEAGINVDDLDVEGAATEEEEEDDDDDERWMTVEDAQSLSAYIRSSMSEGSASLEHQRELLVLQSQIDAVMRRAMHEMIISTASKSPMSEADADWLAGLLRDLVDRLNALTPHRADFHAQLESAIDVDLARQMLLHNAADENDVKGLVDVVYGRLRLLCAPVQDDDVEDLRLGSLAEPDPARMLATLLCKADAVLSFTEELNRQAQEYEA